MGAHRLIPLFFFDFPLLNYPLVVAYSESVFSKLRTTDFFCVLNNFFYLFLFFKVTFLLADMKDSNCLITTSKDTLQLLTPAGLLTNIQKEFSGRVLWN